MAKQALKVIEEKAPAEGQRLDKWLWFARVAKTRTVAAGMVINGKVRVNRVRIIKPAQVVRRGDVITVSVGGGVRVLKIIEGGVRRGPASEAALLYEEIVPLAASRPPISSLSEDGDLLASKSADVTPQHAEIAVEQGQGRPTKKERRLLDRLRKPDDY